MPLVRALSEAGHPSTLLDLPGFGSSSPRTVEPSIFAVADVAAQWVIEQGLGNGTVLFGHSTGAQEALHVALRLQDQLNGTLVLAGPTFEPAQRRIAQLLRTTPFAYRRDSVRELVVLPDFLRGRAAVLRLLKSAMSDRPEDAIRSLSWPVLLTAGIADAFAPVSWLLQLSAAAAASREVRVARLEGSHNNPFTCPLETAALIGAFASSTSQHV